MSRAVANVADSETFRNWVDKTNELRYALSTEIITANQTYANTGTPIENRHGQLYGRFAANSLIATDELRGGNVSLTGAALLVVTSNATFNGNSTSNCSNESTVS